MLAAEPTLPDAENFFQRQTTEAKRKGQYFTPSALVELMLDALGPAPRRRIVDPSCGDGRFLCGAVAAARRQFPGDDGAKLAAYCRDRIIGFDIDEETVCAARSALQKSFKEHLDVVVDPAELRIYQADVLGEPDLKTLFEHAGLPGLESNEQLIVVGNPPYVEAKRLNRETRIALKTRYSSALSGAPDLYLYFLHVCLGWLRDGDRLAFVLPNKLLVNANAQLVRERLLSENRLQSLWFATQTGLFGEAGVYPVILFAGARAAARQNVEIRRLRRTGPENLSLGEPESIHPGAYSHTRARAFYGPPENAILRAVLERLIPRAGESRLDDLVDIRWSVSFHRSGLRERYIQDQKPSSPYARRFLGAGAFSGNGEVTRYRIEWGGWWIDYREDQLRAERNNVPPIHLFERPKIVICQNGRTLRAAFDDHGFVLKDTFLCGALRPVAHPLCEHPPALAGLLCSRAVHFFYSHVFYGGHVNSGYLHFLKSFLVDVPIGGWTSSLAAEVGELVQQRQRALPGDGEIWEEQIEKLVSRALGLTPDEEAAIADWANSEPNWLARERVRGPARTGCSAPDAP